VRGVCSEEVAAGLSAADLRRFAGAESVGDGEFVLPRYTSDSGVQELVPARSAAGVQQLLPRLRAGPCPATATGTRSAP
jgi:hypothetical protein